MCAINIYILFGYGWNLFYQFTCKKFWLFFYSIDKKQFFFLFLEILQSDEVRDTDKKINKSVSNKVETSSSLLQSTDRILPISNEIHQHVETNQDHTGNEKYARAKIMDALEQIDKKPRPRITFIDFAGQSQYYAFLQIYLSPKTCYILVVDMTKSPDANVPDPDVEAGSRFVSWTYRGICNK